MRRHTNVVGTAFLATAVTASCGYDYKANARAFQELQFSATLNCGQLFIQGGTPLGIADIDARICSDAQLTNCFLKEDKDSQNDGSFVFDIVALQAPQVTVAVTDGSATVTQTLSDPRSNCTAQSALPMMLEVNTARVDGTGGLYVEVVTPQPNGRVSISSTACPGASVTLQANSYGQATGNFNNFCTPPSGSTTLPLSISDGSSTISENADILGVNPAAPANPAPPATPTTPFTPANPSIGGFTCSNSGGVNELQRAILFVDGIIDQVDLVLEVLDAQVEAEDPNAMQQIYADIETQLGILKQVHPGIQCAFDIGVAIGAANDPVASALILNLEDHISAADEHLGTLEELLEVAEEDLGIVVPPEVYEDIEAEMAILEGYEAQLETIVAPD